MTPPTHLLFLDLETSHSDRTKGDIIEVAVALTEAMPSLPVVATWQSVILPRDGLADAITTMTPVVFDMHTKNGLLQELHEGKGIAPWAADLAIKDLVNRFVPKDRKVPLAGSGVGHFDRQFVDRDFPSLAKRLTYYPMDTGGVRRFAQMAGVPLPKAPEKTHRAMDCVDDALDEARRYLRLLGAAAEAVVRSPGDDGWGEPCGLLLVGPPTP